MLKFFKKMLGTNQAPPAPVHPTVQLLDFADGLLVFRSQDMIPISTVTVATVTDRGPTEATLSVVSYDSRNQVYRAHVEFADQDLKRMIRERRREVRKPRCLRVASQQLPGYFCTTEDISTGGARLLTSHALTEGTTLELQLDLDDANFPPLKVTGVIRWSARRADGKCHSGVQFLDMTYAQKSILEEFIRS